jgi:thioredoxin-dependent peroxiredoxin
MKVEIGKSAPLFEALSDENEKISLEELQGKNVVLYFYPKDDTPGCTIEAQDFSKKIKAFEALDSVVLGVSKDGLKSHCKFVEKYNIAFNLLVDEDTEICKSYGVIKEKSMFGKKYLGIDRSTFLIDKTGKIAKIWRSVKVGGHVEEVLKELSKLS